MAIELQGVTPRDGASRNVHVSPDNRLMVASKSNVRGFFVSRDDNRLFNAVFEDASAAAGNYVAYLQNTSSSRLLFIDLMRLGAAENAIFKVVTATGTATGGNAVTPVNMNRQSGITAEVTALADNVGGFTAGTALISKDRILADTDKDVPFDDVLILGPDDAVAVEYDTGTTGEASVLIRFFFEDIGT